MKISIIVERERELFSHWNFYKTQLEYLGIERVPIEFNPDIIIIDSYNYRSQAINDFILFDPREEAQFNFANKDIIKKARIVLKYSKYRSHHYYKTVPYDLTSEADKIRVGWPISIFRTRQFKAVQRGKVSGFRWNCEDVLNDRPIDISFMGNIGYQNHEVSYHRQFAVHKLMETSCVKLIATHARWDWDYFDVPKFYSNWVVAEPETPLNPQIYDQITKQSKIVFSPWGNGESCIRDFEAILSGAILLKPETDFIEIEPDIYQPDFYVSCKKDFSDLQEKIDMILDDWDSYEEMRRISHAKVVSFYKYFPRHFADIIKQQ